MGAALGAAVRPADVLVVGSANTDLTSFVTRLPQWGETLQGERFSMNFGGKGANQAVAAARLGAETLFLGKIGRDALGDAYLSHFRTTGVDASLLLRTDEAPTGVAPIFVDSASGDNCILVIPGANGLLSSDDVLAVWEDFPRARVLLCQNEVPLAATRTALQVASEAGLVTLLNTAPVTEELCLGLADVLPFTTIVCPNESELQTLTDMPVDTMEAVRLAAAKLEDMGCGAVLVTLGQRGAYATSRAGQLDVHVPAPQVAKVVNTVGAGDAFCGALAAHLARRRPEVFRKADAGSSSTRDESSLSTQVLSAEVLRECMEQACFYASLSVQAHGAQESYVEAEEVPAAHRLPARA